MSRPTTTIENRTPVTQTGGAKAVAPVDICLTPMGPPPMVPVPYVNVAQAHALRNGSDTVRVNGAPVMLADSVLRVSTGNEPGVGGGIRSKTTRGPAEPLQHSMVVTIEGQGVVCVGHVILQNKKNALGRLQSGG